MLMHILISTWVNGLSQVNVTETTSPRVCKYCIAGIIRGANTQRPFRRNRVFEATIQMYTAIWEVAVGGELV